MRTPAPGVSDLRWQLQTGLHGVPPPPPPPPSLLPLIIDYSLGGGGSNSLYGFPPPARLHSDIIGLAAGRGGGALEELHLLRRGGQYYLRCLIAEVVVVLLNFLNNFKANRSGARNLVCLTLERTSQTDACFLAHIQKCYQRRVRMQIASGLISFKRCAGGVSSERLQSNDICPMQICGCEMAGVCHGAVVFCPHLLPGPGGDQAPAAACPCTSVARQLEAQVSTIPPPPPHTPHPTHPFPFPTTCHMCGRIWFYIADTTVK